MRDKVKQSIFLILFAFTIFFLSLSSLGTVKPFIEASTVISVETNGKNIGTTLLTDELRPIHGTIIILSLITITGLFKIWQTEKTKRTRIRAENNINQQSVTETIAEFLSKLNPKRSKSK